jgi:putative ABC transport system permease protein
VVALATDFFSRRPQRAAATTSAIMVGYALVIVLGSVVYSITDTLSGWLDRTFDADLIVGTAPGLTSTTFETEVHERLAAIPGVKAVERYRKILLTYRDQPIVLVAFDRQNRPDRRPLVIESALPEAYEAAERGEAVFMSESFAFRYGHTLGDTISLAAAEGTRSFVIQALVRDYTFDLGTVFVDAKVYETLWKDSRLTYAKIWKSPGADAIVLRSHVARAIAGVPQVSIVTNSEFRAEVAGRVHGLLRVLDSLQLFASVIAVLSVANLLLASILDRRREISVLRSVGVTRRQIRTAVVVEAGLIGLAGTLLGLLAGSVAAFFMVTHSLRIDMGWTLDFRFPGTLALSTMLVTSAAAALAGYLPARRITAGSILAGLHTE